MFVVLAIENVLILGSVLGKKVGHWGQWLGGCSMELALGFDYC